MASPLEKIQSQIRVLSTSEKEELLRTLWEELDGPPHADVDAVWLAEVLRRDQELDVRDDSIPAEEVFRRLRATLKK